MRQPFDASAGDAPSPQPARGGAGEVFLVFLRLGLTSFGGPVAHLGYFRETLVRRRAWLADETYAELVALCQFLPGPASSQVGMALGFLRAGYPGALAAWVAFTLPSALLMALFAAGLAHLGDVSGAGWLIGVKAAAVAVVAQALAGMGASLTPDAPRRSLAVGAAALALLIPGAGGQILAIGLGALAGLFLMRGETAAPAGAEPFGRAMRRRHGLLFLAAAILIWLLLLGAAGFGPLWTLSEAMFRAGALVFGGGHVVLPLLEAETVRPGLVAPDAFIAGYGAAQAMPGPLFAFASFLGEAAEGPLGAVMALVAIFLPGALFTFAALPFWQALRGRGPVRAALSGVNAAVVGLLLAALYDPVFLRGAADAQSFVIALAAFLALAAWKLSPPLVVIGAAALGQGMSWAGLLG